MAEHPIPSPDTQEDLPRFWRTLEERHETPEARRLAEDEFLPAALDPADPPPSGISRRNFLGLVGAATAVAASTACDRPQGKVVPYTRRPSEIIPGVANHYASTFQEGTRLYPVLVKTREGRPIHITGNDEHPGVRGKTSPRALAEIIRLYDPDRLKAPQADGKAVDWSGAQRRLMEGVQAAVKAGQQTLLLSGAVLSPTAKNLLADLKKALPGFLPIAWEPAESESAREGGMAAYGTQVSIRPLLDKARVILSLGADFLQGADPEAIRAFAGRRKPEGQAPPNRLWVLEGPMTLTGSNADHRCPVKPSRLGAIALGLARELVVRKGLALPAGVSIADLPEGRPAEIPAPTWEGLLADLASAKKEALVLCGPEMPAASHAAVHLLNAMLGSEALEIRRQDPLAGRKEIRAALEAMKAGRVGALILWGVNPAYALGDRDAWSAAAAKVPFRAWIGQIPDESAATCQLLLPENHWLESWNDFGPEELSTLQQPAVAPLYDTRQGEDILLGLLRPGGGGDTVPADYHQLVRDRWRRECHPAGSPVPFDRFFEAALHDGVLRGKASPAAAMPLLGSAAVQAAKGAPAGGGDFELVLAPGCHVHDGRYANSGWLQECPDPVTKTTWGNPLSLAVSDARRLGLKDGDVATLSVAGRSLRVPVVLQPGQASGVLSLALGYGRETGSTARGVGVNAFPLLGPDAASPNLRTGAKLESTGKHVELARTQAHFRLDGRDIVRSQTFADLAHGGEHKGHHVELHTLYPDQEFPDHKWGMVIDLNACVGCSGCVLACQSENNIPVVGPEQVAKGREMHWIRIDRYYEGDEENPSGTVHQPMLCQHCDHAPCENVCPVNATNHSPDGLNQMAYNRCVGTRYCANNCPYKVRRFNFLEYTADKTEPESLAYNPEVTVRPRGVMEKCTFCVQRIQDGKVRAKGEDRPLRDGEIVPACAAGCPAEAIVFGDLKDPKSRVSRLAADRRGYKVLEELGARPAITYLADLRNPAQGGHHAG
ncbi:MAG: TAT-variant-translocated molybdopterin oxidoreductase [Acidobacteria bacterium]|nr:TAT-variant-translocated molybdopterin oxidoreductase [Acidobacteriota bacterium]